MRTGEEGEDEDEGGTSRLLLVGTSVISTSLAIVAGPSSPATTVVAAGGGSVVAAVVGGDDDVRATGSKVVDIDADTITVGSGEKVKGGRAPLPGVGGGILSRGVEGAPGRPSASCSTCSMGTTRVTVKEGCWLLLSSSSW